MFKSILVAPPSVPLNMGVTSAVKPNIMFILDNTHTMRMDFMENYVVSSQNCRTSTNPFGRICVSNANGFNITSLSNIHVKLNNRTNYGLTPNRQELAPDTLFFAYDFNKLFFNPNITYVPAINHLGVSMRNQLINNAQIEPLNPASAVRLRNLLTILEETHFCNISSSTTTDFTNPNRCRRNGVNTPNPFRYHIEGLPNGTFRFPVRSPSEPHYFDIIPNDFCDATGVNCTSNPTLGIPTPVRWCATSADALSTMVPTGLYNGSSRCQSTFTENRYRFPRIGMLHRVTVPEAQHQNFVNWFSYYRTRMLTLRTTVGRVFSQIGDTKRVGLKTINHDLAEFLPISDFNNIQKQLFFNRLYTVHPSGATPLREALSRTGRYFSTQNPDEVVSGLMDALNDITATTGSGAAAATSSPNIISVNNFLYATTYRSFYWDSEIVKRIIDPITGQLSNTNVWSAATLLNSRSAGSSDTRNISFLRRNGAQTELVDFRFSAMNATERGYFTNRCITNSLSQCAGLDISQRAIINGGGVGCKLFKRTQGF